MSIRSFIVIVLMLVALTGCQTGSEPCGIYEKRDPRLQNDSADNVPPEMVASNQEKSAQYTQAIAQGYAHRQLVMEHRRFIQDLRSGFCAPQDVNLYDMLIRGAITNGDLTWRELGLSPEAFDRLIGRYQK